MHVLQILPDLNAGGVEGTTVEMVEALVAAGHGAHVLSAGGRLVTEVERLGGVHHRANIGSKNILSVPWRIAGIRRLIAEHDIDVVHARSRAPAWPAMFAARAEKVPFVTTYHGTYNARSGLKRFYNSVMARGDLVIANSNFTRDHLMAQHGTAAETITVIPRGVDMARFDPAAVTADEIGAKRKSWGVQAGETVLVLPGRLTRWKGQTVAIRALAELPQSYRLILVGDAQGRTDYVAELAALGKSLDVGARVHLAGHATDMPVVLAAADIVLTPSTDPEAFGRTAAEAQAMNRPIVAADHGGAVEVVVAGETGFRTPPGDAKALAVAILKVGQLSGVATARDRIARDYSKSALQAAVLRVYETLSPDRG
jgi:glycosyltransferase involved in cell wall biosynthesis